MIGFSESFKQAKAPWLARAPFSEYGTIKELLSELFKNYHDYGNSPFTAVGATEHICAQDPNKVRLIRDAKQLMVKSMTMAQQAQVPAKKEDDKISSKDFAEIINSISENARRHLQMCDANRRHAHDDVQQQQQNPPADASDEAAVKEWQKEMDTFLEEEKNWTYQTQQAQIKFDAKVWTKDEVKTAVEKFKEVRRDIVLFMQGEKGSEEKSVEVMDQDVVWTSLVRCLVLQHKIQGTVVLNIDQAINQEQQETLRSIAQDEITCDLHKEPGDSIFAFAARLQSQEALSNWIVQALLPQHEVASELYRTDGTLFRLLAKNLPQSLSLAAQMVAENATRDKRRGGTFQQLVAKIRAAGNIQDSEGNSEASQVNSKLKQDAKPASSKSVSFLAAKGKLERNPQAEVTREERRDKSTSETKTIYKPKKRKAKDSESDDDDVSVNLIDSEGEESHHNTLVGMIKGMQKRMEKRMDSLSNSHKQIAQTQGWQQGGQQQQQSNFQRPQRNQNNYQATTYQAPPFQKGICFRFRDTGKCDIDGCKFSHIDEGNMAMRRQRKSSGPIQQVDFQEDEKPQDSSPQMCSYFLAGNCTRIKCRFSHDQQPPTRQQQRQDSRAFGEPPAGACMEMWETSTCDNPKCKWDHGSFDEWGAMCKNFQEGKHCFHVFLPQGCKFSHSR